MRAVDATKVWLEPLKASNAISAAISDGGLDISSWIDRLVASEKGAEYTK